MRTYKSSRGPFAERPYYTDPEIERTCTAELLGAGLLPATPEPIRVDRFVEKRFRVTITYDDLGPGILGLTQFGKSGVKAVVVSRALDEEGTLVGERRVRSTLAHEVGHGLFHAHLFALTGACELFPEGVGARPRVLCRDEQLAGGRRYNGEWWEYQANRAIGALLLPRALVHLALASFTEPFGGLSQPHLAGSRREAAARHLAEVFDVNPIVARRRLDEVAPASQEDQLML